jgi:methionyl-tRNA formyltransferase
MAVENDPGGAVAVPERVVLFGSEGGFSLPLLAQLLAHGVTVAAVVMPGVNVACVRDGFPVGVEQQGDRSGLAGLAANNQVPVIRIQDCHERRLADALAALGVDVLLVACFPWKVPRSIRQLPRLACWNLHPSLLPAYRGPAPLYWQLRKGEAATGLTLHEVSGQLDTGNIVAQQAQSLPAVTDGVALNEWVAGTGAQLFIEALARLREGRLVSIPQDESAASYYPYPDAAER